ncbi:MAG TPA: hypothetical protein VIU61_05020 [Kofleriaceae bacterium]
MKISLFLVAVMCTGCAVDPSTRVTQQASGQTPDEVLTRFRMTGAGAAFVGSTEEAPWSIQYVSLDRYIADAVLPPVNVQFGGLWQDPTSLHLGPYGYYYAAGYSDYAYGELPPGSAQVSSEQAQLSATIPANSDTFYSERCYSDDRIGYRECVALEGETIDIRWQTTGETEAVNGRQEIDMGEITLIISGRTTFTLAHATGTLVGAPLTNEMFTYVTSNRGHGAWIETSP